MKFAVEVEADRPEALDILLSATERWMKSAGATVLERGRDEEECSAGFIVESQKDLQDIDGFFDLPGKVSIEPL
jgi:hypothetical protein